MALDPDVESIRPRREVTGPDDDRSPGAHGADAKRPAVEEAGRRSADADTTIVFHRTAERFLTRHPRGRKNRD